MPSEADYAAAFLHEVMHATALDILAAAPILLMPRGVVPSGGVGRVR
jgi:hypothetical protein